MTPLNLQEVLRLGSKGAAVRNLQSDLNAIGAALVVDGDFGALTEETVLDFQAYRKIVEDGVVGPKTWFEISQALARHEHMTKVARQDRLRVLGEEAVERAIALWALDIYDPKPNDRSTDGKRCKDIINLFIHEGCAWRHEPDYAGDGDFKWCLAFAWYCWPDLRDAIRTIYAASTYRVDRYGAYRSAFGEPNPAPEDETQRRLYMKCDEETLVEELEWEPRAGDIALVGTDGYGTHGVLVESFDKERGSCRTVEGNANGAGPHGERQQGVIRAERFFGGYTPKGSVHVRRVVRPGLSDLKA